VAPFYLFFFPYYGLAVLALFVHLSGALGIIGRQRLGAFDRARLVLAGGLLGLVVASLILAAFGGLLYPVAIPAAYLANLRAFLP